MNKSFKICLNNINNAYVNRILERKIPNLTILAHYSRNSQDILRNRYSHRNKDGSFKEYNETVTIIPKEYEEQDEYKREKLVAQEYTRRYENIKKLRSKSFSLQLKPKKENEDNLENNKLIENATCEHNSADAENLPVKLNKDPFAKSMHQCIFCKYKIPLDYKNVQLLSQFVSPNTGIVYSQNVTGLCYFKYSELENVVFKAKKLGLMPFFYKETIFTNDPPVFDPFNNNLKMIPNNYDKRKFNSDE